jgi:hypothetical protein
MPKSTAPEATPGLTHVYPSPDLPPTDYLPGIGIDGADLPTEEAESLIARGLATTTPPASPVIAED